MFFLSFIKLNLQKLGHIQNPDYGFLWMRNNHKDPTDSGSATLPYIDKSENGVGFSVPPIM